MKCTERKSTEMEKLTIREIRKKYKEKYGRKLKTANDVIARRLEDYQIRLEKIGWFLETQNKQQECERIVELLHIYRIVRGEKDVMKKYHLLKQTLPEGWKVEFQETLAYHEKYVNNLLEKKKNKNTQMVHAFNSLKTMLSIMDKEIAQYSDMELTVLMQNKKLTSITKQHAIWFLGYIYNLDPDKFHFDVEMVLLRREKLKSENDFYSPEEWVRFINIFFDIDLHIERAYSDCSYARYWLYAVLHMSLAWRKSDVLNIPAMDVLIDAEKYTLDWFDSNALTLAKAQKIINSIKLVAEQYCVQKTGARRHFNIPQIAVIPTAVAFIICEQWRRKKGDKGMFGRFDIITEKMSAWFKLDIDFTSIKANRTLLSFFNEKASEINSLSGEAAFLTSYMRSHAMSPMGSADITTTYLHSTYDERESMGMGKQIVDRGAFGWLYHKLLDAAGNNKTVFKENTEIIAELRKNIPIQKVESISEILYSLAAEKESLLKEIYAWNDAEIKEKAGLLLNGSLLSKTDDIYCLMNGRCPYHTENECMLCRYSIPTTFSLMVLGEELKRRLMELDGTGEEFRIDRIRLTYQIGKLVMILQEAAMEFGREYLESYIDYEEVNELIQKETSKMIFLEEK